MARATTTRATAKRGTRGKAAAKVTGRAKAVKKSPPAKTARTMKAAKPVRAAGTGKQELTGRIEQLERGTASLRTRHSELKRGLADLTARLEAREAAPAAESKPTRRGGRRAATPAPDTDMPEATENEPDLE